MVKQTKLSCPTLCKAENDATVGHYTLSRTLSHAVVEMCCWSCRAGQTRIARAVRPRRLQGKIIEK